LGLNINWLPARESTPLLRTITGVLFGIFTGWYLFPMFEETMKGNRAVLMKKKEILRQIAE